MLATVRNSYKNVEKITTNFNSLHQTNPDDPITIYLEMRDGSRKTAEFDYAWASGLLQDIQSTYLTIIFISL